MSKLIVFVGDIEGDIQALRALDGKYDAILQLGDFGAFRSVEALEKDPKYNPGMSQYENCIRNMRHFKNGTFAPFQTPVYFIKGSHEDFDYLYSKNKDGRLSDANIEFVENGTTLSLFGTRIMCLGGIYSSAKINRRRLRGRDRRFFTYADIATASKAEDIDVVITHKAIYGVLDGREEGSKDLNLVVDSLSPNLYLHGHHHKNYTTNYDNTKVVGLGNFSKNKSSIHVLEVH